MDSSIRSKIASYEAHNQEVRATTIASPGPAARTTTSMASNSRRERLQREANASPVRLSKQVTQPGSLAERRRARQLQKQKRLMRESNNSPMTDTNKSVSRSGSESSVQERSRKKPLPEASPTSRNIVGNVSMGSSRSYDDENPNNMDDIPLSPDRRLSPARAAKAHRMHSRRRQQQETAPDALTDYDHSEPPTDDEVTLTSVRQIMQPGEGGGLIMSASSSTIETDGKDVPPTNTQAFLTARAALGDDERTFDYGERDDGDDDASVTYEQRKEAARKAKEAEKTRKAGFVHNAANPLLNTEDVSYYRQTFHTPAAKVTGGLVAAGTVGCLLLGPVGLLVGAAAVGIGVGIMQIPEEQRAHVKDKAVKTVHQAKESAVNASEVLSSSCAAGCHDLGVADHLPADLKEFFENPKDPNKKVRKDDASVVNGGVNGVERSTNMSGPAPGAAEGRKPQKIMTQSPSKTGKKRAACLRNCKELTCTDVSPVIFATVLMPTRSLFVSLCLCQRELFQSTRSTLWSLRCNQELGLMSWRVRIPRRTRRMRAWRRFLFWRKTSDTQDSFWRRAFLTQSCLSLLSIWTVAPKGRMMMLSFMPNLLPHVV